MKFAANESGTGESRPGANWETPPPPDDDWNIEEAPPETTVVRSPRSGSERDRPVAPERPQDQPPSPSAAGNPPITEEKVVPEAPANPDQVYDANYRIITPPPPPSVTDAESGDRADRPPDTDWV
ncbi:MAG: hypothetical protein HC838_18310 [Spirulinaceae cyanobacterium RM2_2_10]|nr:hypothetical protein [Spirulinaceae cyanobacterium RM2_2_10]